MRAVCDDLGLAPSDLAIARGLEPRAAMYRRWFHPRVGAVEVLSTLRTRGYPIALVSMCAPDTPALWHLTELAARQLATRNGPMPEYVSNAFA